MTYKNVFQTNKSTRKLAIIFSYICKENEDEQWRLWNHRQNEFSTAKIITLIFSVFEKIAQFKILKIQLQTNQFPQTIPMRIISKKMRAKHDFNRPSFIRIMFGKRKKWSVASAIDGYVVHKKQWRHHTSNSKKKDSNDLVILSL